VFGAFSTEGLRLCRTFENYYGTREDFLFTLVPEVRSVLLLESAVTPAPCATNCRSLSHALLGFSPRLQQVKVWPWLAGHAKHFVRITMKGIKFGDAYVSRALIATRGMSCCHAACHAERGASMCVVPCVSCAVWCVRVHLQ
jgi:hypothetical protein